MRFQRCGETFIVFAFAHLATSRGDAEGTLICIGADAEHGVISVWYWPNADDSNRIMAAGVQGSAFLINAAGYFITAAHVLEHHKKPTPLM